MSAYIIVIDDSLTIRKIIEACLSREGFAVQCFPGGVDAMYTLLQPGARVPDLVFLDINMPRMNGYQIALNFKEQSYLTHVPLAFITRYNGLLDHLKTRLVGGKAHITKPFTTQIIITTVHTLVYSTTCTHSGRI